MTLRHLEQIQEQDPRARPFPLGALFLSAVAGGSLVVAAVATFQREAPPQVSQVDPLAELLAHQTPRESAGVVDDALVTFPGMLSDCSQPTTALAAVKDEGGRLLVPSLRGESAPPLVRGEGLPDAPIAAGDLLHATSVTTDPKDDLSQLAAHRLSGEVSDMAPLGEEGGYEIQVASFQKQEDADAFVEELRKRGHRAYRQAAYVPDRGLWHRVRVGSFKSRFSAAEYQKKLEREERIATFLVDPDKIQRQQELRDQKQRAQEQKLKLAKERAERQR